MQFAVMIYESDQDFQERVDPDKGSAYRGAFFAYMKVMQEAGVYVTGVGLEGAARDTATIRIRDEKRVVQDGPFVEAKEQLGGLAVIEVESFEAALEWAARCPAASRAGVEVRPLMGG